MINENELKRMIQIRMDRPMTMEERVRQVLRSAILNGMLKSNEMLKTDELANLFQVSRMPIREALRGLASEGFVTFDAYKGARVTPISIKEIEDLAVVRTVLECMAIRLSLPLTEERKQKMLQMLERHRMQINEDNNAWNNIEFHNCLCEGIDNQVLLDTINNLRGKMLRYNFLISDMIDIKQNIIEEHTAILNACIEEDYKRIKILVEKHIYGFKDMIVSILKEMPEANRRN